MIDGCPALTGEEVELDTNSAAELVACDQLALIPDVEPIDPASKEIDK
jgi:hypothetical protein